MKAEEDGTRKVAFVSIPVVESGRNADRAGCTCQSCCGTCFKVSLPSVSNGSIGVENRQKLLTIIEELESEFTTERQTLRLDFQRQLADAKGRLKEAELRAESDRAALQNYLNRPQPTIDESPLKIEIAHLREKLTSVEKERDALLRNKVTFIEANLAERNMHLENEIECLRLQHKDELAALDKSWREKEGQWSGSINGVRDQKLKLELRIKNQEDEVAKLHDLLKKEEAAKAQERAKHEEYLRETTRLKTEIQSHGQISKSEAQLTKERIDEYKERLASAEGKLAGYSKEKDDLFRTTVQQKADNDNKDRNIKDLQAEIRRQEDQFNARSRDATADFQNRLRGIEQEIGRIHQQKANLEKELTLRLAKQKEESAAAEKRLRDEHILKLKSMQDEHGAQLNRVTGQWNSKLEQLQAEHLRETTKPPKIQTKTEYVYIEKQVQSSELKIATERLLQLTSKCLTLETQVEDLRLQNAHLKEKVNFLSALEGTFNREKQKWRLEREQLLKRLSEFELKGDNKNRFEWAVERIIDAEGRGQEHFRYREGGIRVMDTTDPNIVYKVISPEHVYQSLTERVEGDVRDHSINRVSISRQIRPNV